MIFYIPPISQSNPSSLLTKKHKRRVLQMAPAALTQSKGASDLEKDEFTSLIKGNIYIIIIIDEEHSGRRTS